MNSAEKLRLLRQRMQEQGMDAYVVVTDDFHGSEYVGDYFKAREYLSGFTGSAGTLVVLPDSAALWTDGRYFLQAADQLAGSTIDLMRAGQPGVPTIGAFLAQRVPQGGTVASTDAPSAVFLPGRWPLRWRGRTSASPMSRIWPGLCGGPAGAVGAAGVGAAGGVRRADP